MITMKSIKTMFGLPALMFGLFLGAPAFAQSSNSIPPDLRSASFACDRDTIRLALDLKHAAWTYNMPEPKSPQAAWGNTDGRTTWWIGYWTNKRDRSTSSTQPKTNDAGKLAGDDKGVRAWRRGGSPPTPTKIEWLCSESGGIEPHSLQISPHLRP